MNALYNIDTTYNALDDTVYDIFDLDAYCSSLSPSVPNSEPVPHPSAPTPRLKRFPKTRSHPHLSPTVVLSPTVASTSAKPATTPAQPAGMPAQPDKGKGRQRATLAPSPACPVDASPSSVSTDSVNLTPEQHLCLVRVLKRLDKWFAQGWEPGVDKSHLRSLAEVFNSAEAVAEGSLSNIHRADLAWRLSDSEGWEKSAGSSIMGAIDIQVTITKILFKDYGEPLIASFWSFLGQKEAELGNSGRAPCVSGPSLLEDASQGDSKPNVLKRVRFQGLDGTAGGASDVRPERNESGQLPADAADARIPTYDEACKSLAHHLAFVSGTTYRQWLNSP